MQYAINQSINYLLVTIWTHSLKAIEPLGYKYAIN